MVGVHPFAQGLPVAHQNPFRQRNLRQQNHCVVARCKRFLNALEVNLCFARPRDAVQQQGLVPGFSPNFGRIALFLVQFRSGGRYQFQIVECYFNGALAQNALVYQGFPRQAAQRSGGDPGSHRRRGCPGL